jgi:PBP1b-binding outer membrane lipoprotein LpoB
MLLNWKEAGGIAVAGLLLAGCSTPTPMPEPQPVTDNHVESCYRMDSAEQERVGQAKIESGVQFYYTTNCDQHLAKNGSLESAEMDAEEASEVDKEEVPEWIDNREKDVKEAVSNEEVSAGEKVDTDKEAENKDKGKWDFSNKEPTCYYDKMTAARSDLEPCGKEFYDANPHLR